MRALAAATYHRGVRLLLLTVLALSLSACDSGTSNAPADDGTPRIAALSPAIATTLQDLGLEDRIVARHGYDLTLDPEIPVAGDQNGLDYETLLATRPTHVLLDQSSREAPARLTQLAGDRGFTINSIPMLTLDDTRSAITRLVELFAVEDTLTPRLDAALTPDARRAGVGRVLLLMSLDPPESLGPGSHHHEVLVAIGATPAQTESDGWGPWARLDAEDLIKLAPDAIVLIRPDATPGETPEPLDTTFYKSLQLTAAASGRVALIDHADALLPGSAAIRFAESLAGLLDVWAADDTKR